MNILDPLISNTLHASALIACVLLLRWLLRGHVPAQCFHLLWLLVGVRLLLPFAPSSSASVFNLLRAHSAASLASGEGWVVRAGTDARPIASPLPLPARSSSDHRAEHSPSVLAAVIPGIWLAGIALQTFLLGVAGWRMRRALGNATPVADARLLALADECAATLRLRRRVRVFESAAVAGPAVAGLWRPRLLLPRGLGARLSDEQLRFVLLHECAHLRRHDLAVLWLLTAARVVHWFNPLVWLATRAARHDAELACDETVMRHSAEEARVSYGETLLHLTRLLAWHRSPIPLVGILENRGAMRARLANIATYAAPQRWRSALTALLVLSVGFVFAADEKPAPSASETSPAETPAPPTPGTPDASQLAGEEEVKATPHIIIEGKFLETTDTAILRLKSQSTGVRRLREALRDGPDDNVLSAEETVEFHRAMKTARGVDILSAPKVITKSGQPAVIEIIREFR